MKILNLILLLLLVFATGLSAQNCKVPQELEDSYINDLKHLALVRMESLNAPELNRVEIPANWQDTIWQGLAAIYNSVSAARDSVFDQFCIHQYPKKVARDLYVKINPEAPWYQNWLEGTIGTGDAYLDSLLERYGFYRVDNILAGLQIFTIYSDRYLNMDALADSLSLHDHVIYGEGRSVFGGSGKIGYRVVDGERFFDFTVGFGDCLAGCIYAHTWSFRVDADCNVFYLGSSGEPNIPDYYALHCNITPPFRIPIVQIQPLSVYPNPVKEQIRIRTGASIWLERYEIYDTYGKRIGHGLVPDNQVIDLGYLSAGIYILLLQDAEKHLFKTKVIKL